MSIKDLKSYENLKYRSKPKSGNKPKDQDWAIKFMSSMFHRFTTGYQCEHSYNSSNLETLDKYAKGTQGARKVKEKLLRQQQDGTFKGRMRDVFQTFDILPEMIDIIVSNNMKSNYKPTAVAIDKTSLQDKEMEVSMSKFLVQEQTKEFLKFMGIKMQTTLTDEEIATYNDTDVEVLYSTGGIQMQREKEAVAACLDAMIASRYKEIEELNTLDLITFGITGLKVYIDYSEDNVKFEHVDVRKCYIPRSKYLDFRDISQVGYVKTMRLHEIISQCPSITPGQITELVENRLQYNSGFTALIDELDGYTTGENDIFDEFLIPVFDAQWLATDIETYYQCPTASKGEIYKKVPNDYKIENKYKKRGATLDRKQFVKKYEATWVIGTEILLHYEQCKDSIYYGPKGKRIPKLDYVFIKTGKKSIVDRCKTIVDDINLNVAKHRSAIASMPPGPGLIIYEHALQNIKMNGKLQSPKDLIDGLVESGVLVVNGRDSKGGYIASNGGKAVDQIPATAVQQISVFGQEIVNQVNRLRQVVGLPEGLDGTAGNPYTGVGQVQLAAAGSSNALHPTLSKIAPLNENLFGIIVPKRQKLAKRGRREVSIKDATGRFKVLSLSKNFSDYDFQFHVRYTPTEEKKMFMLQQIAEMAQMYVQSSGTVGCSKAEFFMLYKLIESDLLDEAMYQVARIEKLREQKNIQIQQANIEANMKSNQESIAANSQARQQEILTKATVDSLIGASGESNKAKTNLIKEFLASHSGEGKSIPEALFNKLMSEVENDIVNIEQQIANGGQANAPQEAQSLPNEAQTAGVTA